MLVRVTGRTKLPVAYVRFSKGGGRSAKRVEDELAAALLANARGEP